MNTNIDVIDAPGQYKIYHRGPALDSGPLPSVFYFSLSGQESLDLDPFNQPAVFLSERGIRVFSLTLPGHEGAFPHQNAVKAWGNTLASGKSIVDEFVKTCIESLDFLIAEGYVDPGKVGAAGLSRGAYVAAQFAAKDERVGVVLGFAPLTRLETIKDFKEASSLNPEVLSVHALENVIPGLLNKILRFYIGNYDTMVGTGHCFSFVEALTDSAYEASRRFPAVELIIYPSIGHKGHGTPPGIFVDGSAWLTKMLT